MMVSANPKPTEGIWKLGDQELAVGAESVDLKYKSTPFTEGVSSAYHLIFVYLRFPRKYHQRCTLSFFLRYDVISWKKACMFNSNKIVLIETLNLL